MYLLTKEECGQIFGSRLWIKHNKIIITDLTAKYFTVKPDQTQSISILSYDLFIIFCRFFLCQIVHAIILLAGQLGQRLIRICTDTAPLMQIFPKSFLKSRSHARTNTGHKLLFLHTLHVMPLCFPPGWGGLRCIQGRGDS